MKNYLSLAEKAWTLVSPSWPLRNLIAVNPLMGFQELPFTKAIEKSYDYVTLEEQNRSLEILNLHTIKWCQAFFDQDQAIISMPDKDKGFFVAWKNLILHDATVHQNDSNMMAYLKNLPDNSEKALSELIEKMNMTDEKVGFFFDVMLMTLRGWAGYVKYLGLWAPLEEQLFINKIRSTVMIDYLTIRAILFYLLSGDFNLKNLKQSAISHKIVQEFQKNENSFRENLLTQIHQQLLEDIDTEKQLSYPNVQCIFCIDVRSEPIRRSIEQKTGYQTLGFAGFFAAPTKFTTFHEENQRYSAPVLIAPQHTAEVCLCEGQKERRFLKRQITRQKIKKVYSALKYNIGAPCVLADASGPWFGLWMVTKTFFPKVSAYLREKFHSGSKHSLSTFINSDTIELNTKLEWAETFLSMLNLKNRLASVVILFGHAAKTENNPYASALECGACGANSGGYNAQLMAKILNEETVRQKLKEKGIFIPIETIFIAAEHITTTQEFHFYNLDEAMIPAEKKKKIKTDFSDIAQSLSRSDKIKSIHWAEPRPEWGLARNAAFIVGPREFTAPIDLSGRAFLHSYDWQADEEGKYLETIMTAPMIVAQWINHQYFFSTFNNRLYGGGSKITQNITGKFGIMQGNASDLMSGLSLQALYETDNQSYHQTQRLLVIIFAPRSRVKAIIEKHSTLQTLFFNEWLFLVVIEPEEKNIYSLDTKNQTVCWRKHNESIDL